ncbi:MAG: hypothetical protein KF767_05920 [Bdellovibrionaceae bacterium]|nr:hypothetical protein [Pseudobdellovibrionaceae bacterium]
MKICAFLMTVFLAVAAFAEHDATYCGKLIDGSAGEIDVFSGQPEAILEVESRVRFGELEPWDEAYAGLLAIPVRYENFVRKGIQMSARRGTLFCVKGRWGGAAYSSSDLTAISLITVMIERIDYQSAFAR